MQGNVRYAVAGLVATALIPSLPLALPAQIPDTFTNLQYFPEDISRGELVEQMRQFSFALGERCQYCHVGGDGISFEGVEFDSDEDPDKRKARYMLRMVDMLNTMVLPSLPERDQPPVRVECMTCHHGQARPRRLEAVLAEAIAEGGAEAGVARYRELRERYYGEGVYDFGRQTLLEVVRELVAGNDLAEAIAMAELNIELFPEHMSSRITAARIYAQLGDTGRAIEYYRQAQRLAPSEETVQLLQQRIDELRAG